jgi:hypothetical protein
MVKQKGAVGEKVSIGHPSAAKKYSGLVLKYKNVVRSVCLFSVRCKYGGQGNNLDSRHMSPDFRQLAK